MKGPITGISSMATRQILAELAAVYESRVGCKVTIQSMGGIAAAQRIRDGEPADVVILASDAMQQLDAGGFLLSESSIDFAFSDIAGAVREGQPLPPLHDENAVRDAMLAARSIAYSTGPSGAHLKRLWARWRIGDAIASRAIEAPPGVPVASLVTDGKADLGFQQLSELLGQPGIAIAGVLPPGAQQTTIFVAGIGKRSAQPERARDMIQFLVSSEAVSAKARHGMQAA